MASPSTAVARALRERADHADVIISNLHQQIAFLRAAWVEKAAEKLRTENEKLKNEVRSLKTELCVAEISNGVRQYFVPANISSVTSPTKVTPSATDKVISLPKGAIDAAIKDTVEKGGEVIKKKSEAKEAKDGTAKPKAEKKGKAAAPSDNEKLDVSRLDMRIGRIIDVDLHPDADTLYVEKVDLGEEEPRTVVSGLVKHIPIEQMRDKVAIFMCNLKPAKVRGILSQAMIMCASCPDKTEILDPPETAEIGDRILVEEYPGTPDGQLNPKKKIWEQLKPDLRTDKEGVATYKGAKWVIAGKGKVTAKTVFDGQIS